MDSRFRGNDGWWCGAVFWIGAIYIKESSNMDSRFRRNDGVVVRRSVPDWRDLYQGIV